MRFVWHTAQLTGHRAHYHSPTTGDDHQMTPEPTDYPEPGSCVSARDHLPDKGSARTAEISTAFRVQPMSAGENDRHAWSLTDSTIARDASGSTCVYCGSIRLWNIEECAPCYLAARRRLWRVFAAVVLAVGLAAAAAAFVEPIPSPREVVTWER